MRIDNTPADYPNLFPIGYALGTNAFILSEAGRLAPALDTIDLNQGSWRSREQVTLQAGSGTQTSVDNLFILHAGTVLGVITANGKYVPSSTTATDGSENACAILCENTLVTGDVDVKVGVVAREAEVEASRLCYDPSVTAANAQATKLAQLASVGIIVRTC